MLAASPAHREAAAGTPNVGDHAGEQEQSMHGAANARPTALAQSRPARSVLARLADLRRHPLVQRTRRRPLLTLMVLAGAILCGSLTVHAAISLLFEEMPVVVQEEAGASTEPSAASPPPSPSSAQPTVDLLPPLVDEPERVALPVPVTTVAVPAGTPISLPQRILEATNLPRIHLRASAEQSSQTPTETPRLVQPVTLPAGDEVAPVVVAFKQADVAGPAAPVQPALAQAMGDMAADSVSNGTIMLAGCASCGGGGGTIGPPDGFPIGGGSGCSSCGGSTCVPGKTPCYPCSYHSTIGRFLCGVYECVCCPDPCYEPRWTPVTDAAFFTDAPRPITHQRYRWDAGMNLILPDRAEYFWSAPPLGPTLTASPYRAEPKLNYNDLSVYTEIATNLIAMFFEMPYRSLNPDVNPHAAGFGDINMGTKSLLYDCELFQVSFQFKTYILSGNFSKGLGTGHVSLEPSILFGLRISPDTYLQTQVGEWIPFGNPFYSGAILKANASLNQVLWRILPNVPLVGTWEIQSLSFQDGAYTDPYLGPWQKASGYTYLNAGPGLRLFVCDRLDFGVGSSFALTEKHFAQTLFRSEFRIRY